MKRILIATDYTPVSQNAGDYAAQLAARFGAELIVFHAWTPPVATAESIAVVAPQEEFESSQQAAVTAEAERLRQKWSVNAKAVQQMGFAGDEIPAYFERAGADLVVMGLRHANAMGRILGSVATVGIHRWEFPVLVVPEGVEYRPTKTILLATDLKGSGEWKEINMLEHLADTLPAEIHVLNVIRGEQVEGRQENIAGNRLEQKLYGHPHTWHFSIDDDVVTAVSETAARISADWIAVVPHHLPWYKELFHRSVSKQLMFASDRPLLVLPGENQ